MRTKNDNASDFFTYGSDGFSYLISGKPVKIKWLDIESIFGYKEDLLTFDEIRVTILYNGFQLSITEETPGWENFISKTKSIFPSIPRNWDLEILQPPFATNGMTLYKNDHYKILTDFQNADSDGRVRLNTNGALETINQLGEKFKEGIFVLLDDGEELKTFGLVKFSAKENIWVAEINWDNFIEENVS